MYFRGLLLVVLVELFVGYLRNIVGFQFDKNYLKYMQFWLSWLKKVQGKEETLFHVLSLLIGPNIFFDELIRGFRN